MKNCNQALLTFCILALSIAASNAQNTITNVLNNTVTPSTLTIGAISNVSNTSELIDAINLANSGGGNRTILIANGTYQIASTSWYPYITASNVVFRSASGNRDSVIICGAGMADVSPDVECGFYIVGDNVTIADLTVKNVGNHGIAADGTSQNVTVYNVRFQDTYEQMFKGTNSGTGSVNGLIQCCLFEYTAGIGPQYYIGGIDIHEGSGWVVQDNVFRYIMSPTAVLAEHAIHFWDNTSNNTVERNLIINCDRGIGFGLGTSGNTGGIIRNNMIYNNGVGSNTDVGIGLETSPGTRVYNNTVYIVGYPNPIEYRFAATSGVDITNNITNADIAARDGATGSLATNVTNAQSSWFVDLANGNLRLNGVIPTVSDAGTDLSAYVSDDIDKTSRPMGTAFDIGAFENSNTGTPENGKTGMEINIYPNPSSDMVFVEGEIPASIIVTDFFGQKVLEFEQVSTFDIRSLIPGVYFVQLSFRDNTTSIRVVKM